MAKHSSRMKPVPLSPAARYRMWTIVALAATAAVGIVIWGATAGYGALTSAYDEQCRVVDGDVDVAVVVNGSAQMVSRDLVIDFFGLTNGANLAKIDFARRRAGLLKTPNIRDIRIERRMPNRVTVEVFERAPIARVAGHSRRSATDRVVDEEGVVFRFQRNIAALPIIREAEQTNTPPGQKLIGSAAAAVHLVTALAAATDLGDFRVLEIDTSHHDYLLLTLGNYSRAKVAWKHMDKDDAESRASLKVQLSRLARALETRLTPGTTLWNAMDYEDGRIYADDPSLSSRQKGN